MATKDDFVPQSSPGAASTAAGQTEIQKLHMNAIGVVGLVAGAAGAVAPLAAMFFNVPLIADQAGAAVPLVFLISGIGMVLSNPFTQFIKILPTYYIADGTANAVLSTTTAGQLVLDVGISVAAVVLLLLLAVWMLRRQATLVSIV